LPEKRCGNDEGNDGAACLGGKPALPTSSYGLVPNIPLDLFKSESMKIITLEDK
jgi:hypothetical protein